jgi:hypothetical protein
LLLIRTSSEPSSVVQQYSFACKLLAKHLVLQLEVLDDHFLLLANVLDEYGEEDMQRLEEK